MEWYVCLKFEENRFKLKLEVNIENWVGLAEPKLFYLQLQRPISGRIYYVNIGKIKKDIQTRIYKLPVWYKNSFQKRTRPDCSSLSSQILEWNSNKSGFRLLYYVRSVLFYYFKQSCFSLRLFFLLLLPTLFVVWKLKWQ